MRKIQEIFSQRADRRTRTESAQSHGYCRAGVPEARARHWQLRLLARTSLNSCLRGISIIMPVQVIAPRPPSR